MAERSPVAPTALSVDDFIAGNDPDGSLARLDALVTKALPGASRVLWQGIFWGGTDQSIIGYGAIEQPRPRGGPVQWFLIGLARQKNYVSLYVNAAQDGAYLPSLYGDRLGTVKIGSASISFRSAAALDLDVLDELVRHAGRISRWT